MPSTCPLRRCAFFYSPTYGVPSVGFDSHLARAIIVRRHCAFYLPTATLSLLLLTRLRPLPFAFCRVRFPDGARRHHFRPSTYPLRRCGFFYRVRLPGSTVSTERESTLSTERERIWRRVQCVYVAEYRKGKVKLMMMASAELAKVPEYRKGKDLAEGRMCLRS